jgi:nitroreductase
MEYSKVIRERTAVRKFSSKEIEKDKLDKILEA